MRRLARWAADRNQFAKDCELWKHYAPEMTFRAWRAAGGHGAHLREYHRTHVPVVSAWPRILAEEEAKIRARM